MSRRGAAMLLAAGVQVPVTSPPKKSNGCRVESDEDAIHKTPVKSTRALNASFQQDEQAMTKEEITIPTQYAYIVNIFGKFSSRLCAYRQWWYQA